jgi:hypothetical protein
LRLGFGGKFPLKYFLILSHLSIHIQAHAPGTVNVLYSVIYIYTYKRYLLKSKSNAIHVPRLIKGLIINQRRAKLSLWNASPKVASKQLARNVPSALAEQVSFAELQ